MKAALFVSAALCFSSFLWAMLCLFSKPQGTTPFARGLSVCALVCLICQFVAIYWSHPHLLWFIGGVTFYGIAFLLFWSAVRATRQNPLSFAGSSDEPQQLLKSGPYRLIRHPFYTAYLLAWLAGPLGTEQWWLLIPVMVMGIFYWVAARREEAKFAASELCETYAQYSRVAGMFAPKIYGREKGIL